MEFGLSGGDMGSTDDYDPDYSDPDSSLSPIERLEKCMENDHTFSRQVAARSLLETFHQVDDYSDAQRVLKALLVLANDPDGVVRTELSEQLAQVGKFCRANQRLFSSGGCSQDPFKTHILVVVLRFMVDINNQVRKTSQAALVDLVEQKLIETDQVISQVGPIVSRLSDFDSSDDYRSEGATLICKLAPIVGPEIMDQLFLEHFLNLCTDPIFQIRKVCAVSFGVVCQVMGRERTESVLLEKFFRLCGDSIWGVRKACTECFMQVSLVCSASVRHSHLSRAFINLVSDQSRWVRMAAFEVLGAFISTFADPDATGLRLTDDGILVLSEPSAIPEMLRRNGESLHTEEGTDISIFKDTSSLDTVPLNSSSANLSMHLPPIPMTKSRELDILRSPSHCPSELLDGTAGATFGFIGDCQKLPTTLSDTLLQGFSYANENVHLDISGLVETQPPEENGKETGKEIDKDIIVNDAGPTQNNFVTSEHHSDGLRSEDGQSGSENQVRDEKAVGNLNDEEKSQNVESKVEEKVSVSADLIDVQKLDSALANEDDDVTLSAKKEESEFGSSNFWRQLVPEFESASCPEVISDDVVKRCVESCLVVNASTNCDDSCSSVSSKLRDSVSHLCGDHATEAAKMKTQIEDSSSIEFGVTECKPIESSALENGPMQHLLVIGDAETPESKQVEEESINNSSNAGQMGISENRGILGNLAADSTSSLSDTNSFPDVSKDETPMECDEIVEKDLQRPEEEIDSEGVGRPSALINDSETEEIPLDDDDASSPIEETVAEKTFQSLLEMLDVSSEEENSPMDVGEENSLESSVEVDEEEVQELVAAAKNLPCDDIAIYEQSVVPRDLLEQYLSMMDPSCAQKVDGEITRHCAYSLPAVAYTLGRRNWPSLKNLYTTLAADVQWKVRRTLAFSIHELAMIVGEEITSRDLVPVFDGFLNDLDEVRIGVLKHLADFLKLLSVEARHEYLMKIAELLKTDNSRNWRFREELARQLYLLLDLFTAVDVHEHIRPIALHLSEDRVAQVRLAALRVLSRILKRLAEAEEMGGEGRKMWLSYLAEVNEQFAQSSSCIKRQMYVRICHCILQDKSTTEERFAEEFLPTLLLLHSDVIPNVRLTLARTLSQHVTHSEYFASSRNPHYTELMQAVVALQEDRDRDVKFLIDQKPIEVSSSAIDVMS